MARLQVIGKPLIPILLIMRSSLKVTVILSFMVSGILATVAPPVANPAITAVAGFSRADSTRDVFAQNCARCHGLDGRGQTDQGRKYNVPDLVKEARDASSSKITRIITNGRQDMPAFGKKLTKKQIAALTAYVRKL